MPSELAKTRIVKKLLPGQPGTKKTGLRFGDALVCVRYRQDREQGRRYTTVELVIDEGPMLITHRLPDTVHLRLTDDEIDLWRAIRQAGAEWDKTRRAWRIDKAAVRRLRLQGRVIKALPAADDKTGSA